VQVDCWCFTSHSVQYIYEVGRRKASTELVQISTDINHSAVCSVVGKTVVGDHARRYFSEIRKTKEIVRSSNKNGLQNDIFCVGWDVEPYLNQSVNLGLKIVKSRDFFSSKIKNRFEPTGTTVVRNNETLGCMEIV